MGYKWLHTVAAVQRVGSKSQRFILEVMAAEFRTFATFFCNCWKV